MRTERLKGLRSLSAFHVPVPHFVVVRIKSDIKTIREVNGDYGLTIRTCRNDGIGEFGLFNEHMLTHRQAAERLEQLLRLDQPLFYIVYPSWQMIFSWNVFYDGFTYYIEGVNGSQKRLADGKITPYYSIAIPFGLRGYLKLLGGCWSSSEALLVNRLWPYVKRIPETPFYAEAAYTGRSQIVFYEYYEFPNPESPTQIYRRPGTPGGLGELSA